MSIEATESMSVKAAIEFLNQVNEDADRGSEEEVIIVISRR